MSVRMILVLLFNTVSTILDRTIATVTIQHPDHVSCFRYVYDNIHVHTHTHAHTHKQAHTLKHNTRTYNVTLHRLKCAYPLVITITMAIMVMVVINIAPTTSMMIMTVVVIKAATMMTIIFLSSASSSWGPTSRE